MIKNIEKINKRIIREEINLYVRRVSWLDLHKKIHYYFDAFKNTEVTNAFGRFYLSCNQNYPPYSDDPRISKLNALNQIQIHTGHRMSDIYHVDKDNKLEMISEKGSTLWFSQDFTGGVTVFLAPYFSQTHRVNEKNVLVKYYQDPISITDKELQRIFKIYLKYCEATMACGARKHRLYFFRLWLQFKDSRNSKKIKTFVIKVAAQALALLLAGLGIIATLYTGNAIKF